MSWCTSVVPGIARAVCAVCRLFMSEMLVCVMAVSTECYIHFAIIVVSMRSVRTACIADGVSSPPVHTPEPEVHHNRTHHDKATANPPKRHQEMGEAKEETCQPADGWMK